MSRKACQFETPDCKYFNGAEGCHSSTHHEYWPRSDFTTPLEKSFRELPENKFDICRQMHDEIHAFDEPPIKPSIEVMREAVTQSRINRVLERSQQ